MKNKLLFVHKQCLFDTLHIIYREEVRDKPRVWNVFFILFSILMNYYFSIRKIIITSNLYIADGHDPINPSSSLIIVSYSKLNLSIF